MKTLHIERHNIARVGWLRAAVLGANDGIVSTASLVIGVAAATMGRSEILLTGFAGLAAGALSMAAGEYVSVSSQADTEKADLAREQRELASQPDVELNELTRIYVDRGLDQRLARQVAQQLMAHDGLAAHARDELGISSFTTARPLQAAAASAMSFSIGAALPILAALVSAPDRIAMGVGLSSLVFLALLGLLGARTGGAPVTKSIVRVVFWGALAMAVTAGVGAIVGAAV
ncbi:MAG TPA: VIT family protein [Croceibacterium sp.]|nr:VIT family protein [Croceibacterium sp.]